ncbi:MAG: RluA family pseudouridine synthase [Lachnospiraceae bacterium]
MREIYIKENESGQRFDKFLKKYLSEAPGSFLYKMLRKKNIVLNGRKATGSEKLKKGDQVKLFLADETLEKFTGKQETAHSKKKLPKIQMPVVYEDEDVVFYNKPAGVLSQKAKPSDVSVVEYLMEHLLETKALRQDDLKTFRPSICNRLDRNTSGLITAGKSLAGLQKLSELFKDRTLKKYYLCLVKGTIDKRAHICGYLQKDKATNQVRISKQAGADAVPIETEYVPVAWNQEITLLKVHLITGRTHQIRAHLAWQGHPLLGDPKYGDPKWNRKWNGRMKTAQTRQMLHAYELVMPEMNKTLKKLSGRTFTAPVPEDFYKIIKEITWEHGTQEVLEVQH